MVSLKTFWGTALILVVVDQLTKFWLQNAIALHDSYPLTSWLSISHIRNTGVTFGFLQGYPQAMTVIVIAVLAFILYNFRELATDYSSTIATGLIVGGALGNLIDRLVVGAVVDFINLHVWPAFNVADAAICVGALFLLKKWWD